MIDDRIRNLEQFEGRCILFSAPHNLNEKRFVRVNNWQEVRAMLSGDRIQPDNRESDMLANAASAIRCRILQSLCPPRTKPKTKSHYPSLR